MSEFLSRLKNALTKTSSKISSSIERLFIKKRLDDETLQELEDVLLCSDIGTKVSSEIIGYLRKRKFNKEVTPEEVKEDLSLIIQEILDQQDHSFSLVEGKLNIILVCGVNGNGKTTTIGKMASLYSSAGKKVSFGFNLASASKEVSLRGPSSVVTVYFFKGQKKF